MAKTVAQIVGESTAPKICGDCKKVFYHPEHNICHNCYHKRNPSKSKQTFDFSLTLFQKFLIGIFVVSGVAIWWDLFLGLFFVFSVMLAGMFMSVLKNSHS